MGYAEFPHVNVEDTDFHELIKMVKECRDNYNGTLNEIKALSARLDTYEQTVNSQIDGAIKTALDKYNVGLTASINQQFAQINQSLAQWKQETDKEFMSLITKMQDEINVLKNEIAVFENDTSNDISAMKQKIAINHMQLKTLIDNYFNSLTESVDNQMSSFKTQIEAEVQEIRESLPTEIKAVKWLWDYAVESGGYTALEWYNETVTCEQWNESGLTCAQWYTNGKEIFDWYNRSQRLISAISGEVISVQSAMYELYKRLKVNAITAGEYDALRITADRFDNLMTTSEQYDWAGELLYKNCSTVEQEMEV